MATIDYTQIKSFQTTQGNRIGKYLLTKKLGSGNFSTVWLAVDSNDKRTFACKQIKKDKIKGNKVLEKLLNNEVWVMSKISHPNILHLHEQFVSDNNYYLFMDYCEQGDLENYMAEKSIKFFQEAEAVALLRQLMNGFVELRSNKILHRDLKLANIYMKNDNLVIGDFGFAKIGSEFARSKLGTPMTMAPELLFYEPGKVVYNSKADLWSVGVVFYQLLFGNWPFFGNNHEQLRADILKKSDEKLIFHRKVSDETRDLLIRLLAINPKQRIEWEDFFNHSVFQKFPVIKRQTTVDKFIENQSRKIDKDTTFYDEATFSELNFPEIAKPFKEAVISDDTEAEIINENVSKEIFYRFCHEINKVRFFSYTLKVITRILKNRSFPTLDQSLMSLSVLIMLKAIVTNKIMKETIEKSENYYNFNPDTFHIFIDSIYRSKILGITGPLNQSLKKHYDLLGKRINHNNLVNVYGDFASKGKFSFKDIDPKFVTELEPLINFNKDSLPNSFLRDYHLLRVLMNACLKTNRVFIYINDKKSKDPKFNWISFYYTLDHSPIHELKMLY